MLGISVSERGVTGTRLIGQKETVTFFAEAIVDERTGIHAKMLFRLNDAEPIRDRFNVDKSPDRVHFANDILKELGRMAPSILKAYTSEMLKQDLNEFCNKLWATWLGTLYPILEEGDSQRTEPEFWIRPFVLKEGGTLLFGPPGAGKSYTTLGMAISADAGTNGVFDSLLARTVFVNLERPPKSVKRRIGTVNLILGLSPSRKIFTLQARGKSLRNVEGALHRFIRDEGIQLGVVDSLSRAGFGSLSKDDVMNEVIDTLNGLFPSWLALAHSPRNDPTHSFGSIMADAGADIIVRTVSQTLGSSRLGVGLQVTKANDIPPQAMRVYALDFDEKGLIGMRKAKPGEFPAVEAERKTDLPAAMIEYLLDVGEASATTTAEAIKGNRTQISSTFKNDKRFVFVRKDGREVLYGLRSLEEPS